MGPQCETEFRLREEEETVEDLEGLDVGGCRDASVSSQHFFEDHTLESPHDRRGGPGWFRSRP